MKTKSVPTSLVASHPFNSWAVDDYLAEPAHVKKLIMEGTPSSKKRIHWMIEHDIVTAEQVRRYVQNMIDDEQAKAHKEIAKIADALVALELPRQKGEKE